jgi:dUTP pyrophosphatase
MLTSETEIQMKITNETAGNKHKIEMAIEGSPKIARKSNFILEVKRHSENAHLPVRGSLGAAGYDLFCSQETVVPAKGKAIVPTDISIKLPPGTYGRVAPRSGLAVKKFLDVGAGVIDGDYRGKVGVVLFNFGNEDFKGNIQT